MNHPDFFFDHCFENALTNYQNPHILRAHLLCAAWEWLSPLPIPHISARPLAEMLPEIMEEGLLRERRGRYYLSPALAYPAAGVNIRSASGDNFNMVDEESGALVETLDASHAFMQAHIGAVYLHQGESYVVTEFDLQNRTVRARKAEVSYYTQVKDMVDLSIISVLRSKAYGSSPVYLGEVEVTTEIVSFKRKAQLTDEILSEEPLELPPQHFRTVALWFDLPDAAAARINKEGLDWPGALHAAEHAAIGLLPLFAMCDRNDIGGLSTPLHPDTGRAQIFIYDAYPGGVGIAARGFDLIGDLWQATLKAIDECPCQEGCPSCIQSPKCGNNNKPLDKKAASILLAALLRSRRGGG
jgi:DEAD/DEAH box helicase domain-containing protein